MPVITTDIATEVPSVENGGITNGGKTYIFHLRHGVMFQAPVSREVTAADFKWSLERMLNPKMSPRAPAGYLYARSSASTRSQPARRRTPAASR